MEGVQKVVWSWDVEFVLYHSFPQFKYVTQKTESKKAIVASMLKTLFEFFTQTKDLFRFLLAQ